MALPGEMLESRLHNGFELECNGCQMSYRYDMKDHYMIPIALRYPP